MPADLTRFCGSCGATNNSEDAFCTNCGRPLTKPTVTPVASPEDTLSTEQNASLAALAKKRDPVPVRKPRGAIWVTIVAGAVAVVIAIVGVSLVLGAATAGPKFSSATAQAVLLNQNDLGKIGEGIRLQRGSTVAGDLAQSLASYRRDHPTTAGQTPRECASATVSWMGLAKLDYASAYRGRNVDRVYSSQQIQIDGIAQTWEQDSRYFVDQAAAMAFMNGQRAWYQQCQTLTTVLTNAGQETTSVDTFTSVNLNLGLDTVSERDTITGGSAAVAHALETYLRRGNVVYFIVLPDEESKQDPANQGSKILGAIVAKLNAMQSQ